MNMALLLKPKLSRRASHLRWLGGCGMGVARE